MPFKLTEKVVTKVCGDQIEAILTSPRFRNKIWTPESLLEHLDYLGLDYTLDEVKKLNDEMHKRGIVEDTTS